jgi:GNAT superfamily N-acetyltransferase
MMRVIHRPAPVGRISMMVVEEGQRGQGIGAMLVAAAEAHLMREGCQLVEVTSNLARERAHAFYERLGFEKTSVRLSHERK